MLGAELLLRKSPPIRCLLKVCPNGSNKLSSFLSSQGGKLLLKKLLFGLENAKAIKTVMIRYCKYGVFHFVKPVYSHFYEIYPTWQHPHFSDSNVSTDAGSGIEPTTVAEFAIAAIHCCKPQYSHTDIAILDTCPEFRNRTLKFVQFKLVSHIVH
jgi:hypothetical protein